MWKGRDSKMTLGEFTTIQRLAGSHITFSLTMACPLRCAHCAVDAGPHRSASTISAAQAEAYARQMPELAGEGIAAISFTGGEPLLARGPLRILSSAAEKAGMVCGVVTSAYWANSVDEAARVIRSVPGISCWDISIDRYHTEYVPVEKVKNGFIAARLAGKKPVLRMSGGEEPSKEDLKVFDDILAFAGRGDISLQKFRQMGRGNGLGFVLEEGIPWAKPCVTQGMVVREDGSIGPCCVTLANEKMHPFQFGNAHERPLKEIHGDFMRHPLLQLLRVVGFSPVIRWLAEAGMEHKIPDPVPLDTCDLCARLFSDSETCDFLNRRASSADIRLRTAILLSKAMNEQMMLRHAVDELREEGHRIEGYELAAALAEEQRTERP